MIGGNLTNPYFQTYYVSKEESNCPLISDILRVCKNFETNKLLENTTGAISIGYGKRVVMNGSNVNLAKLKREEILEIVDYDPIKKVVLSMGPTEPLSDTPIHCLILRARDDVNAIIQVKNDELFKNLPSTEKEYPPGSLELAKEILKILRISKAVMIKNEGALFVGTSLKEAEDLVLKHMREQNES
jgi:ribulose-5-phosphate 4-epimerase/fuculose-1-phosphate aldolase